MPRSSCNRISRRRLLKNAGTAGMGAAFALSDSFLRGGLESQWRSSVIAYLSGLVRSDGGYGWGDQPRSHLTPTFAVIGCHHLMGLSFKDSQKLAQFVRTHHPSSLKKLEQEQRIFDFQQIQSLVWLGEDVSSFRKQVLGWKAPLAYMRRYERHGYPVFQSESSVILCRKLLSIPVEDLPTSFFGYLVKRQRQNGSFNNTLTSDGGDGHVMNTWWGLRALDALGHRNALAEETVAWLRSCQLVDGGFTYQPNPKIAAVDDIAYTWAALRGLEQLGAAPSDPEACKRYLSSLWNTDGGFCDRAGWESNPVATYYALDCLRVLEYLDQPLIRPATSLNRTRGLPSNLKVFSIQIQNPGSGSPYEAVDLAQALKIHFWGAKNAQPGWIDRAQEVADQREVPLTFFTANEEYGTWLKVPGLGTYSHVSDIVAPSASEYGPSVAGQTAHSWSEFRENRIEPLLKAGGRLVWQFGENEELVRILLDDSIQRGGYAAISTFHFGNPDFTNSEPFLNRYRGQIPFVALQDAHGHESWWLSDMIAGFRTIFLARERTWKGWLQALENKWVVAVRHDAVSGFETWMHGGSDEVVDFVNDHSKDWQWWDNPEIQRPMVSIVAISADDEFEVSRPEAGVTLRIRCAWENTAHGRPKKPITELVRLQLDGDEIHAELVEVEPRSWRDPGDNYYQHHIPEPAPGLHRLVATVRRLDDRRLFERTTEFRVPKRAG